MKSRSPPLPVSMNSLPPSFSNGRSRPRKSRKSGNVREHIDQRDHRPAAGLRQIGLIDRQAARLRFGDFRRHRFDAHDPGCRLAASPTRLRRVRRSRRRRRANAPARCADEVGEDCAHRRGVAYRLAAAALEDDAQRFAVGPMLANLVGVRNLLLAGTRADVNEAAAAALDAGKAVLAAPAAAIEAAA